MEQQANDVMLTDQVSMKRKSATQLFVYYCSRSSGENELISFDYKSDLDQWLANNSVQVLQIIRGVRREFTAQTRVILT